MQKDHRLNIALFDSMKENFKYPFVALDHNGKILFHNEEAASLLRIQKKDENLFDLLAEFSTKKISSLVDDVYVSNKSVTENILLSFANGNSVSSQITISTYKKENELFVFCTFKPMDLKLGAAGKTEIKSTVEDLKEVIHDENIFEILSGLKSLYPFTFIGKEKVLADINKIDDFFWIKDIEGNFVVANKSLAKFIGLSNSQLEGKSVKSFIPSFLNNFLESVENYIKETCNFVIVEGISLFGASASSGNETIFIPIIDAENSVIAFIGITQKVKQEQNNSQQASLLAADFNLLENYEKPICFIDSEGIIRHQSKEFCKLFSSENNDFRNYRFEQILPLALSERIHEFVKSSSSNETIDISENVKSVNDNSKYFLKLGKIFDNENNHAGITAYVETAKLVDELETIIKTRGRMFDILIQNNPEPIFIYDTENLRFIEVNEAALALYGYTRNEFMQMDLTDLYTAEDIQTLLDTTNAASAMGKFNGPFKQKRKNGTFVYVEISKVNFKYNDKDAHFNIIRDVTENLEAEKKSQLFKSVFDNTEDLLFVTDANGFITFINSSVKNKLGYTIQELDGTTFTSLAKDDDRAVVNTSIFQSHLKETVSIKVDLKKNDGNFFETELTATPVLDYNGVVDSFTIISRALKSDEAEMAKEVLVQKYSEPVASNQAAGLSPALLPNIFHEILTPINVILGFVQELKESISNPSDEQKEAIDFINQNRERLLATMNSIVEYSSLSQQAVKLDYQEVQITELIDYLHDETKEISSARGIEFGYGKISSSLKFETDKQKFQTIISILTKIIFQIAKSKKVYFSALQLEENSFVISIKDNYSSASKYLVETLTSLFLGEESSQFKDMGISRISLKLAKSLLILLKGEFKVLGKPADKNDYGFIFPVSLAQVIGVSSEEPIEPQSEKAEETKAEAKPDLKIKESLAFEEEVYEEEEYEAERVVPLSEMKLPEQPKKIEHVDISSLNCLYIEDQVDSQILFKVQMKELKEIKFAVSFEDALPLLDSSHFDFIVMDINLQGEYNGLDALKIIHKMPGYENIPIIAVTAYVLPGDKEKFIATGFNDFISKPIFREKMIESLEKIFLLHV